MKHFWILLGVLQSSCTLCFAQYFKYPESKAALNQIGFNIDSIVQIETKDTLHITKAIQSIINHARHLGYLSFSCDSIQGSKSYPQFLFYLGRKYQARNLKIISNLEDEKIHYINTLINKQIDSFLLLHKNKIISTYESKGYPFCIVTTQTEMVNDSTYDLVLKVEKGPKMTLSDIEIIGSGIANKNYIKRILNFKSNEIYNSSNVASFQSKISQIRFLESYREPTILFLKDKAIAVFFINKKNINRFDVLIGFQPNSITNGRVNNKHIITGNALIELVNQFGKAERIFAEFQRPSAERQLINFEASYPLIINSPIGAETAFKIEKFDSTFVETSLMLGASLFIQSQVQAKITWERKVANLLSIDEQSIIQLKKLPQNLDYKTDFYGLEFQLNYLDNTTNPRSGIDIKSKLSLGSRTVPINQNIATLKDKTDTIFNFRRLYDTISFANLQIKPKLDLRLFLPIKKRLAWMLGLKSSFIYSKNKIFQNEKFRIGGIQNLRGFNEQSIFNAGYLIIKNEFKMILDPLSSLYIFADYGLLNYEKVSTKNIKPHLGIGGGLNFGTKVGVFGIVLAVGKTKNVPFDFQKLKIHFGYQNYF